MKADRTQQKHRTWNMCHLSRIVVAMIRLYVIYIFQIDTVDTFATHRKNDFRRALFYEQFTVHSENSNENPTN